jgi:hypothetical protein
VALQADDPLAPAWANLQRDQDRISRNVARYWLTRRYKDNELGGGWGDDVELLGQLSKIFVGRQDQTDRRMLDSMQRMIQYGLNRSGEVIDGYFGGGMTDVEHSGEYTTNPYIASRHLFGHVAQNGETALGVAEHLAYTAQPAKAFAGLTNLGRLHFKSYYFTTEGPSTDPSRQIDILLNGRALYPAVAAGLHGALDDSQIMISDLADWAKAWRDDAQETTGGKPAGWYGPVQWPSNIFGKSGNWWTHTGSTSDLSAFTSGVYGYTLELLRMAYRTSQSSDRWTYLLPMVRMFRAVKDWEDAGMPAHSAGTNFWAAKQLANSNYFGAFVVSFRPDLENDPDLTSLVDPLGSGYTYVDSGLLDRMETWAEDVWCGQHTMIKYALNEIDESGSAHTAKPIYFDNAYEEVTTYYRVLFPLLTKHAMHTDRVFITYGGGGPNNLIACATGTDFREGLATRPLVRWNSRLRPGQDMAIQCNYRNYDATKYSALVYSFESAAMETTIMLDEGLVPGSYLVEWGEGTSTSDVFLTGTPTTSVVVQKPGRGVAVDLTLEPGLNLVRVIRQGDANPPASAYDLAVDPPNVQFLVQGPAVELQFKARVANLGLAASPISSVNFYVSLINSDGSIIQYPGFPKEIFLGTKFVPPLAATGGWTMDEYEVMFGIPVDNLIVSIFLTGRGFQLRTEVAADGLEMDLLNNNQVQSRTVKDVDVFY